MGNRPHDVWCYGRTDVNVQIAQCWLGTHIDHFILQIALSVLSYHIGEILHSYSLIIY